MFHLFFRLGVATVSNLNFPAYCAINFYDVITGKQFEFSQELRGSSFDVSLPCRRLKRGAHSHNSSRWNRVIYVTAENNL